MNKVIEGFQSVILHHAEKPNNEGTFIRHLERSWSNKHFLYPLSARAELGAQGEDAEWELRNMKMNEGPADGEEQASVCEGGVLICLPLSVCLYISESESFVWGACDYVHIPTQIHVEPSLLS